MRSFTPLIVTLFFLSTLGTAFAQPLPPAEPPPTAEPDRPYSPYPTSPRPTTPPSPYPTTPPPTTPSYPTTPRAPSPSPYPTSPKPTTPPAQKNRKKSEPERPLAPQQPYTAILGAHLGLGWGAIGKEEDQLLSFIGADIGFGQLSGSAIKLRSKYIRGSHLNRVSPLLTGLVFRASDPSRKVGEPVAFIEFDFLLNPAFYDHLFRFNDLGTTHFSISITGGSAIQWRNTATLFEIGFQYSDIHAVKKHWRLPDELVSSLPYSAFSKIII